MDLRQLAALVAVAETGSFSAAAERLHTVQSNVSSHVARLERELGVALIDRAAGRPTEEGALVVERARRVADELESLRSDLAALHDVVTGTARLGTIGTTARWMVPQLLAVMDLRYPDVRLVVTEGTSTTLEPRLVAGSLDVAIVNLPVLSGELVSEVLMEEDLLLVVPSHHPFANAKEIDLTDLDGIELLLPPKGTAFRDEVDAAVGAVGAAIHPKAELDGVRLIASLTFEGHGPAILPASALPGWLRGEWRQVRVRGLPRRRIGVVLPRKGRPAAPVRALLVTLRDVLADPSRLPPGLHLPGS